MPAMHHVMLSGRLPKSRCTQLYTFGVNASLACEYLRRSTMSSASDWRSVSKYDYLKRLDRSEFVWEFLRRNAAYQEDYNTLSREAASDAGAEDRSAEILGRRWGLYFRRRST